MYVRGARNREEVWLLDQIERMDLDDLAFRSRDFVIAIDEDTNERAGFGRLRVHKTVEGEVCEFTSIGVIEAWREQGVGAHIIERLVDLATDNDFTRVYAFTSVPEYFAQFGFKPADPDELPEKLIDRLEILRSDTKPDAVPLVLETAHFEMPPRLRERFKAAHGRDEPTSEDTELDPAEDFGIDPETATYKYDTDGRID